MADKLKDLQDLLDIGAITATEYDEKKAAILAAENVAEQKAEAEKVLAASKLADIKEPKKMAVPNSGKPKVVLKRADQRSQPKQRGYMAVIFFTGFLLFLAVVAFLFKDELIQLFQTNQYATENELTEAANLDTLNISGNETISPSFDEEQVILDIREKYKVINFNLSSYTLNQKDIVGNASLGGEIEGYFKNSELKKLVVTYYGETGKSIDEYYFWDDQPFFVFTQKLTYDVPVYMEGSKVDRVDENRFYFFQEELIRWIDENQLQISKSELQTGTKGRKVLSDARKFKENIEIIGGASVSNKAGKGVLSADKINLRREPSLESQAQGQSNILSQLSLGTVVTILDTIEVDVAKIKHAILLSEIPINLGSESVYLQAGRAVEVETYNNLYVYCTIDLGNGKHKEGVEFSRQSVKLVDKQKWYHIKVNDQEGYVYTSFVKLL